MLAIVIPAAATLHFLPALIYCLSMDEVSEVCQDLVVHKGCTYGWAATGKQLGNTYDSFKVRL